MHKSVLPKDIKMPAANIRLPPVHLSVDAVAGIDPGTSWLSQELHAFVCTATADCSTLCT